MSDSPRVSSRRLAVDVQVRRYPGMSECDVVVTSRTRELVLSCPDYDCAVRWARMECKSYGVAPRFQDPAAAAQAN
ncbi:MAG: hypothetical protein JWR79_820 [Tardiphaga sp.]|jgi:hypothetical protein|nr:hypothetical protein [Tardiphaga sp.]